MLDTDGTFSAQDVCLHVRCTQVWDIRNHKCLQTIADREVYKVRSGTPPPGHRPPQHAANLPWPL